MNTDKHGFKNCKNHRFRCCSPYYNYTGSCSFDKQASSRNSIFNNSRPSARNPAIEPPVDTDKLGPAEPEIRNPKPEGRKKSDTRNPKTIQGVASVALLTVALFMAVDALPAAAGEIIASPSLTLWDTGSPIGDKLNPGDRSAWKVVPNDLLQLEKDPPKASSDPGYYGRDYSFKGDAVVETTTLTAVFWSSKGCVTLYSRAGLSRKDERSDSAPWIGSKVAELAPLQTKANSVISGIEIVRNAGDAIVLKISFSAGPSAAAGVFSFDKTGIVEVKPAENMNEVRLSSSFQYGVVPSFIGDDLIFGGSTGAQTNTVCIPSENQFLGLLPGESTELIVTWPKGNQRVSLRFDEPNTNASIKSVDFNTDGLSFYVAALNAPGIWHKESMAADYLEKDVKVQWKRPFPAKWKTQLYEEEFKTTFAFRTTRGEIWRGVAGSYVYPVWFNGDEAYYHLSKKIQPKGESLIYYLEGQDTPPGILTPADMLRQTLGRQVSEPILDLGGRQLRTHHRRAGVGVRRACTCGCTEAIQAIFEAGEEVSHKDDIQGALGDMIYFVHCHVERINEYRQFADALLKLIQEKRASSPELKPFLDSIEEIVRQIPDEYEVQKENMKSFGYADDLSAKTLALTDKNDPNNVKAYMELLKAWRAMGGAQDYVLAKCHIVTRNVSQAAGYGCADLPGAVSLAEDIRSRCRQTLRHPDGYEIWADY